MIHNSLSVVRLPDRRPIEVTALTLVGSVASYAWETQFTLANPTDEPYLAPSANGPAQVEVTINGTSWVFVVESRTRSKAWAEGQGVVAEVGVAGRSPSALLAAPYAPLRSRVTTADRTVHQLADDEVENTGFTIDYGTVDWVVPAGAWFYEGVPPAEALIRLAAASGAVVLSHPSQPVLLLRPRYPVSPWDWPTSPVDVTVSDDIVFTHADTLRSRPDYNAVVVTGELAGKGVTVRVVRAGESPVLYAEQISDALINTVPAGRERGRNVLSDRGAQSEIVVSMPVFPVAASGQPGPIMPLSLVRMLSVDQDWVGLATAITVNARWESSGAVGALVIDQTVTIERHYGDAN